MATVTAFLKHSHVGKGSQAEPYTAAAHARYVTRRQAASLIYSERMPKQYHAVQRFLNQHEDSLRKNGRVIDKFIISVPHDVSEQDAAAALRKFGYRMGKGKAPFLFALHGFDTRNHHAHFIFIDRDPDTGRRVFGTSEKGSSADIKLEWETAANDTFEALGYDVRVKVKEGYELANDTHFQDTPEMVEDEALEPETDTDTVENTEPVSEESMDAPVIEQERDEQVSLAANYVRLLYDTQKELGYLNYAKNQLETARGKYASLVVQRERANLESNLYVAQTKDQLGLNALAQERLKQHQRRNGKLKGLRFKVLSYEFKSGARKAAEEARDDAQNKQRTADYIERKRGEYRQHIDSLDTQATEAERDAYLRQQELTRVYGSDDAIQNAEKVMSDTVTKAIQEVPIAAARDAYEDHEITAEEYRSFLMAGGYKEELRELEEDGGLGL